MSRPHPVFDLNETGIAMMRTNLRRRNPHASDAEIDALLLEWIRDRPGAPAGDADGIPSARFTEAYFLRPPAGPNALP